MPRLLVALAGMAVMAVALSSGAAAKGGATFLDLTGEDPDGPDITSVGITQRSGFVTVRIAVPNRPVFTEDMRVALWIDSDRKRTTGLGEDTPLPGADYYVNWDRKLRRDASLLRCSPSRCVPVSTNTFRFSYANGATFRFHLADVGEPRVLRFSARAYSGVVRSPETGFDFTNMRVDFAPEEGKSWRYRLLPAR